MEYSLQVIQRWQSQKAGPNLQKRYKKLAGINDRNRHTLADDAHDKVFSEFDCLACANCCKTLPALISKRDIKRISKFLSLTPKSFSDQYVRMDEDGDYVIDGAPCPFLLEDNRCSIYEVRPSSCRQYPHTGDGQFFNLLDLHRKNLKYCPALSEVIDLLSKE